MKKILIIIVIVLFFIGIAVNPSTANTEKISTKIEEIQETTYNSGISIKNIFTTDLKDFNPSSPKGVVLGPMIIRRISANFSKGFGSVSKKDRSIIFGFGPYGDGKVSLGLFGLSGTFYSGHTGGKIGLAIYVQAKWFFGTVEYVNDRILIDGWGINLLIILDYLVIRENLVLITSDDAYVNKLNPTQNYGKKEVLEVTDLNGSETSRSYLKFDLSSIPSDATIFYALLGFYYSGYEGSSEPKLGLSRVNTSWSEETITWDNQPDFSLVYDYSFPIPPSDPIPIGWLDITDLAKAWFNGDIPNNGLILKFCNHCQGDITKRLFRSKEWNIEQEKPTLIIAYY